MNFKFIPGIKRRWLRRIVMIVALPWLAVQYLYIGLRSLVRDFKPCWDFEHS